MAKKKKKKGGNNSGQTSPSKYITERARLLPIYKCYISQYWESLKVATILVVRQHPQGTFTVGNYFVDCLCRGLANGFYLFNISKEELDEAVDRLDMAHGIEEVDYATVHNLILGGIEFAEEAGIKPCKEWSVIQYILEEDTDDIPLITFDYGKNGHHMLSAPWDEIYKYDVASWEKKLGEDVRMIVSGVPFDNYQDYLNHRDEIEKENDEFFDDDEDYYDDYYEEEDDDDYYYDEDDDGLHPKMSFEEMHKMLTTTDPEEKGHLLDKFYDVMVEHDRIFNKGNVPEYTYKHPEFPTTLVLHDSKLLKTLEKEKLSHGDLNRIFNMPIDELRADLCAVIYYNLGLVYKKEYDDVYLPIANSLVLLRKVGDESCLAAVLEILRLDFNTQIDAFGCCFHEVVWPTLYVISRNNLHALVDFIEERGLDDCGKTMAVDALLLETYGREPERHDELLGYGEELLDFMTANATNPELVGGYTAASLCLALALIGSGRLREKLEEFYVCGCVDENLCGKPDAYQDELDYPRFDHRLDTLDPYEYYDSY